MSTRKNRPAAASTTPPARKTAPQVAPKVAHGPRRVRLPSAKAAAIAATKGTPEPARKPVTPQLPAPGPHTIAGMRTTAPAAQDSAPATPANEPAPAPTESQPLPDQQAVALPLNVIAALLAIAPVKDVRHSINGVFVHQVGQELRLVATDGHRMLVITRDYPQALAWGEAGIILPAVELGQILKYTGKDSESFLQIKFGTGHQFATISDGGIASFQVKPIDGQFPTYQRILDTAGHTLVAERTPMETAGVDAKYVKAAGVVSVALNSKAMHFFPPADDRSATIFTFAGCPGALLIIMPCSTGGTAVSSNAVRLIGEKGMASSIAALKAHATRTRNAAKESKDAKETERLTQIAADYDKRIAAIRADLTPALPAPAPTAQAEAA